MQDLDQNGIISVDLLYDAIGEVSELADEHDLGVLKHVQNVKQITP